MYSQCVDGGWIFDIRSTAVKQTMCSVPYADSGMHLIPAELEDEDVLFVEIFSPQVTSVLKWGISNQATP